MSSGGCWPELYTCHGMGVGLLPGIALRCFGYRYREAFVLQIIGRGPPCPVQRFIGPRFRHASMATDNIPRVSPPWCALRSFTGGPGFQLRLHLPDSLRGSSAFLAPGDIRPIRAPQGFEARDILLCQAHGGLLAADLRSVSIRPPPMSFRAAARRPCGVGRVLPSGLEIRRCAMTLMRLLSRPAHGYRVPFNYRLTRSGYPGLPTRASWQAPRSWSMRQFPGPL